jgi:hypothetical protein
LSSIDGIKKIHRRPSTRTKPIKNHFAQKKNDQDFFSNDWRRSRAEKIFPISVGHLLILVIVAIATIFGLASAENYKVELENQSRKIESDINDGLVALDQNDNKNALKAFKKADQRLNDLKINLQASGQYITYFFYLPESNSKLVEASRIVKMASAVTAAINLIGENLSVVDNRFNGNENYLDKISIVSEELSTIATAGSEKINRCRQELANSEEILKNSDSEHFKKIRQSLIDKTPQLSTALLKLSEVYQLLPTIFAVSGEKEYLLLFQNNSELRPAGGFLGSFAVANFRDGHFDSLDFQTNIYKLDKAFSAKTSITEPEELMYISNGLAMRDSNYHYDFAEAMKKTLWFYEQESGKTADGVIALDTTLVTKLLEIVGPIKMPEYNLEVTSNNFLKEVEYQVEIGYFDDPSNWSENEPKKILAELMPKLVQEIFAGLNDSEKQTKIISLLTESLSSKHLLFYSNDATVQDYFEERNYAGRIRDIEGADYLFLSQANIGGKKSSLNIEEIVGQEIEIDELNNVSKTVDIKRLHHGSYDWPDGINKTYNKLIVPVGAKVTNYQIISGDDYPYGETKNVEKSGYKTYEENGRTIIAFWQNTKPGESSEISISFKLPYSDDFVDSYRMLIQKQPGVPNQKQIVKVNHPKKRVYFQGDLFDEPIEFYLEKDSIVSFEFK